MRIRILNSIAFSIFKTPRFFFPFQPLGSFLHMLAATFSTVIVFRALVPVSSPPPWSFILTAVAQPSSALFSLAFPCFLVNCVNFSLCLPLPSLAHSQFSFLISRSYPLFFATFLPIFLSLPFDSSTFFPLSSTFFSFTPFSSSNSLRLLLFSSPTSLSLSLCSFPLLFPGRKPFLRFFLRFASGSFLF